jgi:hypothetical protein
MTTPSLSNKRNRVIRANLAVCVNSSELLVQLEHHGLFDINDGQGFTVTCIDGTVWITQANDPRDIVINAGQSFLLDKQGLALVAAPAGQATIAVRQASPESPSPESELEPAGERLWVTGRNSHIEQIWSTLLLRQPNSFCIRTEVRSRANFGHLC